MSAAVVQLNDERAKRDRWKGPFAAYFHDAVWALIHEKNWSTKQWRVFSYALGHLQYGQRIPMTTYTALAEQLHMSKGTVYRAITFFLKIGVFYRHQQPGDWPHLYLSAYIAYRGKLNVLGQVRQWEDMMKAAQARGESVAFDLTAEHAYAGGIPDDDELPTLPDWLEDA